MQFLIVNQHNFLPLISFDKLRLIIKISVVFTYLFSMLGALHFLKSYFVYGAHLTLEPTIFPMFNFNANLAFHMGYFTVVFYDLFNPKGFGCPCVLIISLDHIFNLPLFG
jgi:hypothetical protein